jgi:hypothetical protein
MSFLDEHSSNNTNSSTNIPSSNILDPLHELFTITAANKPEGNTTTNNSGIMTNEKIMALFNMPQTSVVTASGMNIRPASMQPPNRM